MIDRQRFETVSKQVNSFMSVAYQFILEHSEEWSLKNDVDLEVTNHVLRVRIQDKTIQNFIQDVLSVCHVQNTDGGWGTTRDDEESKSRSSAFCVQMLLRANRYLNDPVIEKSILKGLDFIIAQQKDDGSWVDPTWHSLDATSTSVGTLLYAVNEDFALNSYKEALKKGMDYVQSNRHDNGLWYYKESGSPVTITAHLLQKCATYFGDSEKNDLSIRKLIELQHSDGHWDNGNSDHTCDAIRAMMLASSQSRDKDIMNEVFYSSCKAIDWLNKISLKIGGGLGDKPGKPAHVERTCDGIDAMLKFQRFVEDNTQLIHLWS